MPTMADCGPTAQLTGTPDPTEVLLIHARADVTIPYWNVLR